MKSKNPRERKRVFLFGGYIGAMCKFPFEDNHELEIKQRLSNQKSNQLCKVNTKQKYANQSFKSNDNKTKKNSSYFTSC